MMNTMVRHALAMLFLIAAAVGCEYPAETAHHPATVEIAIRQQMFTLELALDPASRHNGLGGREYIGRRKGMLLVLPRPKVVVAVMRESLVPIDVAFLDGEGQVLALHTMSPEPPRRRKESEAEYEARLPLYSSRFPVRFALEVAGGRLTELGIAPGHELHLDWKALARRAI